MSNNIYSNGDWVLQHPIAASVTFAGVLVVSAVLEFLIDNAAAVRNKYFRVMFNAINQEIMIVGVLILTMTFAQTLYDWPARWVLLFQWAMVALFFMTLLFVCLILGTLSAVTISTRLWLKFEVERMDTTDDLSSREHQYKAGFSKFQQALEAFGYDASMGIRFSKYIAKLQRRNIVALTDLQKGRQRHASQPPLPSTSSGSSSAERAPSGASLVSAPAARQDEPYSTRKEDNAQVVVARPPVCRSTRKKFQNCTSP